MIISFSDGKKILACETWMSNLFVVLNKRKKWNIPIAWGQAFKWHEYNQKVKIVKCWKINFNSILNWRVYLSCLFVCLFFTKISLALLTPMKGLIIFTLTSAQLVPLWVNIKFLIGPRPLRALPPPAFFLFSSWPYKSLHFREHHNGANRAMQSWVWIQKPVNNLPSGRNT